jgi:hypothetical protein
MKKVLLLATAALLLLSCGKLARLYVYGAMARSLLVSTPYGMTTVEVFSDPIMDTASATVNGKALIASYFTAGDGNPMAIFMDTTVPATGTDEKLEVKTDVANASAAVKVPGDFTLTISPADSTPTNAQVTVSWTAATDAQWYMANVELDTGLYAHKYKDTVIIVNATSTTVPGAWLDKAGYLYVTLSAGYGPKEQKGTGGNVSNALGFFIGTNTRNQYLLVGHVTGNLAAGRRNLTPKEISRAYLEALAPTNETAAEILAHLK